MNCEELLAEIEKLRLENEALQRSVERVSSRLRNERYFDCGIATESVFPEDTTTHISKITTEIRYALFPDACTDKARKGKRSIRLWEMSDRQYDLYCEAFRGVWDSIKNAADKARAEGITGRQE